MESLTLRQLYQDHQGRVSDKWSSYLDVYEHLLGPLRDKPIRLLEIGIQNGGSLEIWSKYFPAGNLFVGCDINPKCGELAYDDKRISVVIGNINDSETDRKISQIAARFDVVIDDGSHTSTDIISSFVAHFPKLEDNGIYIIEDLHCSYWGAFEGGLYHPASSMAFLKALADVVNAEHWGAATAPAGFLQSYSGEPIEPSLIENIHSIKFLNSICIIEKKPVSANILGHRFIAGSVENTIPGHTQLHGSPAEAADERHNPYSQLSQVDELARKTNQNLELLRLNLGLEEKIQADRKAHEAEVRSVLQQLSETNQQLAQGADCINNLESEISALNKRVADLKTTLSWKITAPLRKIQRFLLKIQSRLPGLDRSSAT